MSGLKSSEVKDFIGDRWVLVVDPSPNFRDSVRRFLTNLGIKRVKLVGSADDARRELITSQIGLFIVEWLLPDQNGLEFCRTLRRKKGFEKVPFLLVTSENLRSDVVLASEAGVDSYLLKPFAYDDFCEKLTEVIRAIASPTRTMQILQDAEQQLRKGDVEAAKQIFLSVLGEKPNSARAMSGLGRIALMQKDYSYAIAKFEQALLVNSEYLEAYASLLDAYESIGDVDKQREIAERAHALSPDNPRYTLLLAKIYFDQRNVPLAEDFFKKTIHLSPKLAEAFKGLGNVQYEKEEYEKAIKNYKKALDLSPADIALLNSIGLSYVKRGMIVQGTDYYKMALRLDANDWRVLFNMAYAYEKLGDVTQALNFYERALAINPDLEKAERRLKRLRGEIKDAG